MPSPGPTLPAPVPEPVSGSAHSATQQVVKVRRDYNSWVGRETMEDYALRFAPQRSRRWSTWQVANTAFGAASFLVLEAVGATLLVQYGFTNALWAILATGLIIFLAGLPISIYAARYGVDMDLLTRGAGFGYIGSTITSLIYAAFTFIFFALEAAVMAYALQLALDIPPVWGYLLCAVVVIPMVTHGVAAISRFQAWTQPLWVVLLLVPFITVFSLDPGALQGVVHYIGEKSGHAGFDLLSFGAALTVGVALMTQMGEQADYLRFMPAPTPGKHKAWWASVLIGGPGWVVLGVLKMLGGALLAYLAIHHAVPPERAVDPNQMYLAAYEYVFPHYGWAVAVTALFVVISQLKINVTNAYAGSLAWSNFFSRLTHSHPGRVVWVVFNTLIAFMLMEMNLFAALGDVLGLFSNVAIAWMMTVVADLVINKPLGLSPPGIEFKRAYLYDINPVGVGAMGLASIVSISAYLGWLGPLAQAFSAMIACGTALLAAPAIAALTRSQYYLARQPEPQQTLKRCVICERDYEGPDMAFCPAYQGSICSLCCTLDARCGDLCKPHGKLAHQWQSALRFVSPKHLWPVLDAGLGHFLMLMLIVVPLLTVVFGLLYHQETKTMGLGIGEADVINTLAALKAGFFKAYMAVLLLSGLVVWWVVLANKSREVAQEESNRQTSLLMREIDLHEQTDHALQQAKALAERAQHQAEQANQAKSRYISAISHELRTPLNSILGYAQLMGEDSQVPAHRKHAVQVIRRGGEHLLSLIEGTLDIARIESGKLTLDIKPMDFADAVHELAAMFELQAAAKGLHFEFEVSGALPELVRADDKRVRQIIINLLGNAIKFTSQGQVMLRVRYAREMAFFDIADTGPGMSAEQITQVFEPFTRGAPSSMGQGGAGLGLTIAKMLTDLMGGALSVDSTPGVGSVFHVKLFLPEVLSSGVRYKVPSPAHGKRRGYSGPRRHVLVVDNEDADREVLSHLLSPLGFVLRTAASGHDALDLLAAGYRPDVIFMDLAMPGIDGWETIRRLRAMPRMQEVHVAVVSANAFDKALENDAGISSQDFITKPVRHAELLDWLAQRLKLTWLYADLPDSAEKPATEQHGHALSRSPSSLAQRPSDSAATTSLATALPVHLSAHALQAMRDAISLGYLRGILNQLDQIRQTQPHALAWTQQVETLARRYEFESILPLLGASHMKVKP